MSYQKIMIDIEEELLDSFILANQLEELVLFNIKRLNEEIASRIRNIDEKENIPLLAIFLPLEKLYIKYLILLRHDKIRRISNR
jgi:hypothetical protein